MPNPRQRIAVLGDLHFETQHVSQYEAARQQVRVLEPQAVFQLGDQGGYSHAGSWLSFLEGRDFLAGFDTPAYTLIGNHDLEGGEFATDGHAVEAWCRAFRRDAPYYTVDLGAALGICLSSTRFRANLGCHHEVHLEEPQVAWLEATLAAHRRRPTFIFSHAPILGSGVRVLQSIHLRCPNAWLNHTDRPERFIHLVRQNPQVKLWFSAHNHLGHGYPNSISQVGGCTFVHTGVIGHVTRDGLNQSRLVDFDSHGFVLSTLDHASGEISPKYRHDYRLGRSEWLAPHEGVDVGSHYAPPCCPSEPELALGPSAFVVHRGMLVEFDLALQAPLGVVRERLEDETFRVRSGRLEIVDRHGQGRAVAANAAGRYFQVFEPNPFRKRLSA